MLDFLQNLGKRKLIGIIILVVCLIVLPLILLQAQQQQQIRQRAEGASIIHFELDPVQSTVVGIGYEFYKYIYLLNPSNKDISAVDVTITYDSDTVELVSFYSDKIFTEIISDTTTPGKIHYVGVNTAQNPIIDSRFSIGVFTLRPKSLGVGSISFSDVIITASGEPEPLAINPADNKLGTYTIGEPTPAPSSVPAVQPSVNLTQVAATSFPASIPTSIPTSFLTPIPTRAFSTFESSVFPPKGPTGTRFQINTNADPGLQITVDIKGSNIDFSESLYDDGNHSDGRVNDGTYTNIFDSTGKATGTYLLTFKVQGQPVRTISFEILDLKIVKDTCIPITKNGDPDKKIDIVVVPNNYEEKELSNFQQEVLPRHINYIFSMNPFSLNKDKFNVWMVRRSEPYLNCFQNAFCADMIASTSLACPFFDRIIVINKQHVIGVSSPGSPIAGSSDIDKNYGRKVTLHEFGHSLGGLYDEYEMHPNADGDSGGVFPNCDTFACPKWCSGISNLEKSFCNSYKTQTECITKRYNGINCQWLSKLDLCEYPYSLDPNLNFGQSCQKDTACYYGCGSDGYRSSLNSVMNSDLNLEFNEVSKRQIQKVIDSYVK